MRIYNSLVNKKEEFHSIEENIIKMYVCGPTVYNYPHIGNYRPTIFFDVVKRYFLLKGYKVIYASNVTDVDDKIIAKAIENNKSEKEIAQYYEKCYFEGAKKLNCLPLDFTPKCTNYIDKMIDFIKKLVDTGYAYEASGDVYFRVNKINDYGILSNQLKDNLEVGSRIELNTKKENPEDFTLWKKTTEGIKWDSPFGLGRPGWHTECVVMNESIFNNMIDIHGGGTDLRFPHHENEIAQQNALHHNHLANYWMHVGRIDFECEKMSKSLGNCVYLEDITKNYDLNALRFLILAHNYRQPIKFSYELLEKFNIELNKVLKARKNGYILTSINCICTNKMDLDILNSFYYQMDDDFNTPNVITIIYDLVKKINVSTRSKLLEDVSKYLNTLDYILNCLGIRIENIELNDDDKNVYLKWQEARNQKDFINADKFRLILEQRGLI